MITHLPAIHTLHPPQSTCALLRLTALANGPNRPAASLNLASGGPSPNHPAHNATVLRRTSTAGRQEGQRPTLHHPDSTFYDTRHLDLEGTCWLHGDVGPVYCTRASAARQGPVPPPLGRVPASSQEPDRPRSRALQDLERHDSTRASATSRRVSAWAEAWVLGSQVGALAEGRVGPWCRAGAWAGSAASGPRSVCGGRYPSMTATRSSRCSSAAVFERLHPGPRRMPRRGTEPSSHPGLRARWLRWRSLPPRSCRPAGEYGVARRGGDGSSDVSLAPRAHACGPGHSAVVWREPAFETAGRRRSARVATRVLWRPRKLWWW